MVTIILLILSILVNLLACIINWRTTALYGEIRRELARQQNAIWGRL